MKCPGKRLQQLRIFSDFFCRLIQMIVAHSTKFYNIDGLTLRITRPESDYAGLENLGFKGIIIVSVVNGVLFTQDS
jgi:hypothetical protein